MLLVGAVLSCCGHCSVCCSGQAYVAAFLAKPDKATVEDSVAADKAKGAAGSSSSEGGSSEADQLFEVGTFAQVHTMMSGESPDSAQLLLLGHRRLKREDTVSRTGGTGRWLAAGLTTCWGTDRPTLQFGSGSC
jgi:hypothetical protein